MVIRITHLSLQWSRFMLSRTSVRFYCVNFTMCEWSSRWKRRQCGQCAVQREIFMITYERWMSCQRWQLKYFCFQLKWHIHEYLRCLYLTPLEHFQFYCKQFIIPPPPQPCTFKARESGNWLHIWIFFITFETFLFFPSLTNFLIFHLWKSN